ncbi:MAG TPA: NAD-binding protein, partial [Firmicutes bacterium]|nr:NAD-binding protein [Bacillota bacterium]
MHVVIIGGGKIGSAVAAELVSAGHQVQVVERDGEVAARLDETLACSVL